MKPRVSISSVSGLRSRSVRWIDPRWRRPTPRADPPRAGAGARPAVVAHGDLVVADAHHAFPGAHLYKTARVQHDQISGAVHVPRFLDRREGAFVGEVEAQAVLRGVADRADSPQRLEHLEADRPNALLHAIRAERVRGPHAPLPRTASQRRVGVHDTEVRIHAEAGDELRLAAVLEALHDATVVHVS